MNTIARNVANTFVKPQARKQKTTRHMVETQSPPVTPQALLASTEESPSLFSWLDDPKIGAREGRLTTLWRDGSNGGSH